MCRYLASRGASKTKSSEDGLFPMYAMAEAGSLDVCKLLYANGAKNDVRGADDEWWTPFHVAAIHNRGDVLRWLTLHGALCADSSSESVEGYSIYPETFRERSVGAWSQQRKEKISSSCQRLIECA